MPLKQKEKEKIREKLSTYFCQFNQSAVQHIILNVFSLIRISWRAPQNYSVFLNTYALEYSTDVYNYLILLTRSPGFPFV